MPSCWHSSKHAVEKLCCLTSHWAIRGRTLFIPLVSFGCVFSPQTVPTVSSLTSSLSTGSVSKEKKKSGFSIPQANIIKTKQEGEVNKHISISAMTQLVNLFCSHILIWQIHWVEFITFLYALTEKHSWWDSAKKVWKDWKRIIC